MFVFFLDFNSGLDENSSFIWTAELIQFIFFYFSYKLIIFIKLYVFQQFIPDLHNISPCKWHNSFKVLTNMRVCKKTIFVFTRIPFLGYIKYQQLYKCWIIIWISVAYLSHLQDWLFSIIVIITSINI